MVRRMGLRAAPTLLAGDFGLVHRSGRGKHIDAALRE
jgi:hypothetical protein